MSIFKNPNKVWGMKPIRVFVIAEGSGHVVHSYEDGSMAFKHESSAIIARGIAPAYVIKRMWLVERKPRAPRKKVKK